MVPRILAVSAVLLLAACTDEPPMTETRSASPPPSGPMARAVESARADLADRLEVPEERVEVIDQRWVTWPDGAMGCPEPGMMYTQALVPGVWIRLSVDGTEHVYHGRRDAEPFRCPADRATPPPESDPLS